MWRTFFHTSVHDLKDNNAIKKAVENLLGSFIFGMGFKIRALWKGNEETGKTRPSRHVDEQVEV
ncbi:hypothetical protein [Halobacillus litoralis]|uniref:hypothetical protein n=1 Tax=Halobacillus litoralis TaxID=45668 RepID=UPI001CD695FC|nr:hypothetical protein [Halobacillus litoralis]MCA1021893.1 hypothetical protein [Halobacillus litoralis]